MDYIRIEEIEEKKVDMFTGDRNESTNISNIAKKIFFYGLYGERRNKYRIYRDRR